MLDVRTTVSDAQIIAEAPPSPTHVTVRREDYRPPDWLVPEIRLDFDLDPARTRVRATLTVERNGDHDRALRLDGSALDLLSVKVNGGEGKRRLESEQLVIEIAEDRAIIETEVD